MITRARDSETPVLHGARAADADGPTRNSDVPKIRKPIPDNRDLGSFAGRFHRPVGSEASRQPSSWVQQPNEQLNVIWTANVVVVVVVNIRRSLNARGPFVKTFDWSFSTRTPIRTRTRKLLVHTARSPIS